MSLIVCRGCQGKLRVPEALAGKVIKCPKCARKIVLRAAQAKTSGAVAAQAAGTSQKTTTKGHSVAAPAKRPVSKPKPAPPGKPTAAQANSVKPPVPNPAATAKGKGKQSITQSVPRTDDAPELDVTARTSVNVSPARIPPAATSAAPVQSQLKSRPTTVRAEEEEDEEDESSLPSWASLWGLSAFVLGGLGLLLASLLAKRWVTIGVSSLGVAVAVMGIPMAWNRPAKKHRVWLGLGATMSSAVLILAIFAPEYLSNWMALDRSVATKDMDQQVAIPRELVRDKGRPLAAEDWTDAVSEAIRQEDIVLRVESADNGQVSGRDDRTVNIHIRLSNLGAQTIAFAGFAGDKHPLVLSDDGGRTYRFVEQRPKTPARGAPVFDAPSTQGGDLAMGEKLDYLLVFTGQPVGSQALKLEVPASAWGRKGTCKLRIPRLFRAELPNVQKSN
jgi:hypothetical protein